MKKIVMTLIVGALATGFIYSQGVSAAASGDFSSPAASASYASSGDMSVSQDDETVVSRVENNQETYQWGRSTGCSTGCSVGCSSGCSSGCSVGCRRW